MASLAEIRDSIIRQATAQGQTDDSRLRFRFVDHLIRQARSQIIRDLLLSRTGISSQFYQIIDCLEIKCGTIQCKGIDSGVKQFYVDLPRLESTFNNIMYFGSLDGKYPFNFLSYMGFLNLLPDRFGSRRPSFTILADQAILADLPTSGMVYVRLIALLADPMKGKCLVLAENDPYPLPEAYVHRVEIICLKQILSTMAIVPDEENNATDDSHAIGRNTVPNE